MFSDYTQNVRVLSSAACGTVGARAEVIKAVCVSVISVPAGVNCPRAVCYRKDFGTPQVQCWAGEPLGAGACVRPAVAGFIWLLRRLAALQPWLLQKKPVPNALARGVLRCIRYTKQARCHTSEVARNRGFVAKVSGFAV